MCTYLTNCPGVYAPRKLLGGTAGEVSRCTSVGVVWDDIVAYCYLLGFSVPFAMKSDAVFFAKDAHVRFPTLLIFLVTLAGLCNPSDCEKLNLVELSLNMS